MTNTVRDFVYKVMYDSGGAPCVADELLSLAICKPQIRRTAAAGDRVWGFGGNDDTPANRLIYVGVVSARLADGDYYRDGDYADRPDAIYAWTPDGELRPRDDAAFHTDVTDHVRGKDIGVFPAYANASVLIFDDYRYFGHRSDDDWKTSCPNLAAAVDRLGQGHLVRHSDEVRSELDALRRSLWRRHRVKDVGRPTESTGRVAGRCDN